MMLEQQVERVYAGCLCVGGLCSEDGGAVCCVLLFCVYWPINAGSKWFTSLSTRLEPL